ncbi:hypothetical protein M409DRAFT_69428 [Zasmidium cellare ATCC 36951]|uniref:RNA polymerase II subunit B1 CTD phosphatase RPAP2 homolog n=1 Tax=Zasmidium cellare ATCC 36951 TaxID=1080233 RepID=A0A6A6C8Y4_ZASCE|nr:uncharacterized protein M409DRAFT_69428 [Zasmidium cellare ATCC 36951]KAF2161896.1 hypothetical protein M409DRAFT_69428 [Zasmidium cellare ATCC 36951]
MSSAVPAKSILKRKPTAKAPTVTDEQKEKVQKDRQNLNIALKHAYLIQHRKDVEAAILNSIVVLVDYPASTQFSTDEAFTYLKLVKAFQPSDFDSLVEERRIDGKCGYVLCANKPRSQSLGEAAIWKLKKGMGDWCSNDCAKKAFYVKAQLSQVPAWERVPEERPDIQLHQDDRMPEMEAAVRRANRTARVDEWRKKVADNEELAKERGEKTTSFRPNQVMADTIVEKQPKPFKPFMAEAQPGHYSSIEGYQPKQYGKSKKSANDSEEDDSDVAD